MLARRTGWALLFSFEDCLEITCCKPGDFQTIRTDLYCLETKVGCAHPVMYTEQSRHSLARIVMKSLTPYSLDFTNILQPCDQHSVNLYNFCFIKKRQSRTVHTSQVWFTTHFQAQKLDSILRPYTYIHHQQKNVFKQSCLNKSIES